MNCRLSRRDPACQNRSRFMQSSVLLLVALAGMLFYGCSEMQMKTATKQYRGQGAIRFKKGPFLGIPGFAIQMPQVDLSVPLVVEYDLTGIPPGTGDYTAYLCVTNPCLMPQVLEGRCSFQVKKDGAVGAEQSGAISEMRNAEDKNLNRFYFFDHGTADFHVSDTASKWQLVVACTNHLLKFPVKAFVEISEGGYK